MKYALLIYATPGAAKGVRPADDGVIDSWLDAALVAVSCAPFPEIDACRQRMGWSFRWYSSAPGDFNYDFGVSATPEQRRAGGISR